MLSGGCVCIERRASLRWWAVCSALSAAVVVLAMCRVTSSGHHTLSHLWASEAMLNELPPLMFNVAMSNESTETSALCWQVARLMFWDVQFTVLSDHALKGVSES